MTRVRYSIDRILWWMWRFSSQILAVPFIRPSIFSNTSLVGGVSLNDSFVLLQ